MFDLSVHKQQRQRWRQQT